MLKKNLQRNASSQLIPFGPFKHGVICGANIKTVKEKRKVKNITTDHPLLKGFNTTIDTWGIFIHIKMDNGDQIDAIFKMYRTKTHGHAAPMFNNPAKKFRIPVLQQLFAKLFINEWVQLIGTEVYVYTKEDKGDPIVVCILRDTGDRRINIKRSPSIYPDYFEIHKDFFNK